MSQLSVVLVMRYVLQLRHIVTDVDSRSDASLCQWFSTGVPRNPGVPRASAKGSAAGQ